LPFYQIYAASRFAILQNLIGIFYNRSSVINYFGCVDSDYCFVPITISTNGGFACFVHIKCFATNGGACCISSVRGCVPYLEVSSPGGMYSGKMIQELDINKLKSERRILGISR
jgi:hypothetical protein